MRISGLFAGKAGVAAVCLALVGPLLGGCATQPSEPTVFGARIVPSNVSGTTSGTHLAAGNGSELTIFGVPVAPAQRVSGGTTLASMP